VNKGFFKALARLTETFKIETPYFKAQGPPAILLAVGGIIVAGGIAGALAKGADRLPETLREARQLTSALRGNDSPRLHA